MSPWPTDEIRNVPLERLDERFRRYRLVDAAAERAVRRSLERYGQLAPIVVWEQDEDLVLIDGFKRLQAGRTLKGTTTLAARCLEVDAAAAKAAIYTLNRLSRPPQELEEAWIVHALVREDGLSQVDAGALLGRHKSWVNRRLAMWERLAEAAKEELRLGLLSPTMARQLTRLPVGNQTEALAAAREAALTSAELSGVVDLLLASSTGEQKALVLEEPRRALQQAEGMCVPSWDPRLSTAGNRVARQLAALLDRLAQINRKRVARVVRTHRQARDSGGVHPDLPAPRKSRRGGQLAAFEPAVRDLLERYPEITVVRLLEELRGNGYTGSYTVLREQVRQWRSRPPQPPVVRFETLPGAQAQMDWATYDIAFTLEGRRRVQLFSYLLSYSRRQYLCFTEQQDMESTLRQQLSSLERILAVQSTPKTPWPAFDPDAPGRREAVQALGGGLLPSLAVWASRRRGDVHLERAVLSLTDAGRKIASRLVRSHRLWEAFLFQNLGLPLDHVHEPAAEMEHFIGDRLQHRLAADLGAAADPHGRVIPPGETGGKGG